MKISTRFSLKSKIIKYALIFFISVLSTNVYAQTDIGGIINDYESVISISNPGCNTCDTNPVCINQIGVGDASAFSVGDKVLIVQLKGATIDQTNTATGGDIISLGNAGNYEFFDIADITGNVISPSAPLKNTYDAIGVIQIIRVPNFTGDVNVISELQAQPWSNITGTGGIIALFVEGTLTLNANINASGVGYVGVEMTANGSPDNCGINPNVQYNLAAGNTDSWFKGGGVSVAGINNQKGRAPLGNGGGAGVSGDSGGGGGANYGSGGIGGDRWCDVNGATAGGIGGNGLSSFIGTQNRVFFGGAGGAGFVTSGNSATASNGGGIVVIRATTLVGNNNIIDVSGIDATATATGDDGGGGGGAGGSIAFDIESYVGNLTIDVEGGNGQSLDTGVIHGPGGGGGGGVFLHNLSTLPGGISVLTSGGNSGVHNIAPNIGNAHNAQPGNNGGIIAYYDIVETEDTDVDLGTSDGVPDLCDLDSDNDGILDSVEDGGTGVDPSLDADGDGIPNYRDQSDITVGFPPFVDTNGDGVNDIYDTDSDGTPDFQDLDSDNDGCFDSIESDGTDANNDGALDGDGFNSVGQVTTGGAITDGYDGYSGDETNATEVNYTAPSNQAEIDGDTATFSVTDATITSTSIYTGTAPNTTPDYVDASAVTVATGFSYQWYLGDPATTGIALTNNATYSGVTTPNLSVLTDPSLDGTQYCVIVTNSNNLCENVECAILTVLPDPCDALASGNADNDGDNISDGCDLDDDNDGVLDTLEGCTPIVSTPFVLNTSLSQTGDLTTPGRLVYEDASGNQVIIEASGNNGTNNGIGVGPNDGTIITDTTTGTVLFEVAGNSGSDQPHLLISAFSANGLPFDIESIGFGDIGNMDNSVAKDGIAANVPGTWSNLTSGTNTLASAQILTSPAGATPVSGVTQAELNGWSFTNLVAQGAVSEVIFNNGDNGIQDGYNATFNPSIPTSTFSIIVDDLDISGTGRVIETQLITTTLTISGTICPDTDGDGITDNFDLDADNDGIYDIDEAGNGALDTNGNGFIDAADAGGLGDGDGNGANDVAEATTPIDTGSDGSYDFQNTDSDGDGCSDANEAYNNPNADGGDGGQFGSPDPASVNPANGLVTETDVDYSLGTNAEVTDGDFTQSVCYVIDPCDALASGNADNDGDNISDGCDLDDDNDGILDTLEGCAPIVSTPFILNTSLSQTGDLATPGRLVYEDASGNQVIIEASGNNGTNNGIGVGPNDGTIITDTTTGTVLFEVAGNSGSDQPHLLISAFSANGLPFDIESIGFGDIGNMDSSVAKDGIAANVPGTWSNLTSGTNTLASAQILTSPAGAIPVSGVTQAELNLLSFANLEAQGAVSEVIFNNGNNGIQDGYNATFTPSIPTSTFSIIVDDLDISGTGRVIETQLITTTLTISGTICPDTDGDGITDNFDLDADNDGIYDIDEAGNGALDTNGNGFIDAADAGGLGDGDGNGANDVAEATTPIDTGSDGSYDFQTQIVMVMDVVMQMSIYNPNADGGDGG
ncbi:cell surface calcium-binding acidic-repeat protein, partial [Flavobacteriales bacterium ALC-1]